MAKEKSFYSRYLAGEHVLVWKELCALGADVFERPLYPDALRVCREVVRRAKRNFRVLHRRLLSLGYEFKYPEAALVDADSDAIAQLDAVEKKFGRLPLIVSVWYRTVGSLNFDQSESQLTYDHELPPPPATDVFGLGDHSQLVVQSVKCSLEEWEQVRKHNLRLVRHAGAPKLILNAWHRCLPLGSTKSSCCPNVFRFNAQAIDVPVWESKRGNDVCFVVGLREYFKWGGFPLWSSSLRHCRIPYDLGNFQPNFRKLLPILREGLVEL